MPLKLFIDISVTENLSLLDKNYNIEKDISIVPVSVLVQAWSDINLEYTGYMDDGTIRRLTTLLIDIEVLKIKSNIINNTLTILTEGYDEELVNILREFGYNFKFDKENKALFLADVNRVASMSKSLLVKIKTKEAQARTHIPEEKEQRKITMEDWLDSLVLLSDDAGYPVRSEDVTVYEYTRRHNNYMRKMRSKIKNTTKNVR